MSAVAVLLVVFMIFAFAGCKEKPLSAQDVLANAKEKTGEFEAYWLELDFEILLKAEQGAGNEMKQTIKLGGEIKADGIKGDNPTIWLDLEMNSAGRNSKLECYVEDKISYVQIDGEKHQAPIEEDALGDDFNDVFEDEDFKKFLKLFEDAFEDATAEKDKNGNVVVKMKISGNDVKDLIEEESGEDFDELIGSGVDLDFGSINVEMTFDKNGYYKELAVDFKMDMGQEGTTAEINVELSVEIKGVGEEVEITPPAGYKNYPSRSENGGWNEF